MIVIDSAAPSLAWSDMCSDDGWMGGDRARAPISLDEAALDGQAVVRGGAGIQVMVWIPWTDGAYRHMLAWAGEWTDRAVHVRWRDGEQLHDVWVWADAVTERVRRPLPRWPPATMRPELLAAGRTSPGPEETHQTAPPATWPTLSRVGLSTRGASASRRGVGDGAGDRVDDREPGPPLRRLRVVVGTCAGGRHVAREDRLAVRGVGQVAGVAAAGGPGLVALFAVVSGAGAEAVGERGQGVAVPLLERIAGQRGAGVSALVGQDGELVDQVRVLRPAGSGWCRRRPRCRRG